MCVEEVSENVYSTTQGDFHLSKQCEGHEDFVCTPHSKKHTKKGSSLKECLEIFEMSEYRVMNSAR